MDFLITPYVALMMKYNISLSAAFLIWHSIEFALIVLLMIITVSLSVLFEKILIAKLCGKKTKNIFAEYVKIFVDFFNSIKKEDIVPFKSDKLLFWLAPVFVFTAAVFEWCLLPFTSNFQAIKSEVGVLLFIAVFFVAIFGIMFAGIASKSNFSIMGTKRICLQLITSAIPLCISVMGIVLLAGSMNLQSIVEKQYSLGVLTWFFIPSFIGFLVFVTAMEGLINSKPFNYSDAESEIAAGYKTEFSGVKYSMFNIANHILTAAFAIYCVVLFFGGYMPPVHFFIADFFSQSKILYSLVLTIEQLFWLFLKTYILLSVLFVCKAAFLRLRGDKFALIGWKYLIPLSVINLLLICLIKQGGLYA